MFNNNKNNNVEKKGRTYNFCLNSNFGGNTPTTYSSFFVDWSVLPEGEYKVSFSFTSAITSTDIAGNLNALLYLDLGQASTSMIKSSTALSNNTYRGSFLGCLRQTSYAIGTTTPTDYVTFLYADKYSNPPIYLFTRPRNNNVSVEINRANTSFTSFSPIGDYVLTLSFELQ